MMYPVSPTPEKLPSLRADVVPPASTCTLSSPGECHRLHVMELQTDDAAVVDMAKPVAKEPSTAKTVEFLDGIRGTAVLFVVCHHVGYLAGLKIGTFGVDTFFVLSAFLLTMILDKKLRALYMERAAPRRWGYALTDYAVRRVLRVYPLFALVAIAVSLSSDEHKHQWFLVKHNILGRHWDLAKVVTFDWRYRFFMLWTLPLELTYYLVIPLFVVAVIALQRWWWMPVLPLTGWVLYTGLTEVRNFRTGFRSHLPTFVCGSLAAIVFNRIAEHIKMTGFQFKLWHRLGLRILEALVLVVLVSEGFEAMVFDWFGPSPFRLPQSNHFVCVHVAIIIVCEMLQPSVVSTVFEWNLLRYAGKISFSVYLLHPRIIHSDFIRHQKHYYTHFFCTWALVFFWGTVSYHLVEQPSQKLAAWVGKKIKALDMEAKATQHQALFA